MRIASIARFWQATKNEECGGFRVVQPLGCGLWAVGDWEWEDLLLVSARVGEGGVRTPGGVGQEKMLAGWLLCALSAV